MMGVTRWRPRQIAKSPEALEEEYRNGRQTGFADGWLYGFHFGMSQAVIDRYRTIPEAPRHNVRVLYVTTGKGVPYSPLDEAIVQALQASVVAFEAVQPDGGIAAAAKRFMPDFMLVLEGTRAPADQVKAVRARGIRTAVWFTDDPYYTDLTANIAVQYDYVFTLELSCVPYYTGFGCRQVHYLPLGANTSVFYPRYLEKEYRREISFIGSAYWNRVAFFDRIAPALAQRDTLISGWWWDRLKSFPLLSRHIGLNNWMTPDETAKHYFGSRIVINLHRSHDDESYNHNSRKIPALSVNPRTFEISAAGAFQLSDERLDLPNMFEVGREIVTYSSPADLVEKMNYYLQHEEERRDIAVRGLTRTLRDHTYRKRLDRMFDIVFGQANGGG